MVSKCSFWFSIFFSYTGLKVQSQTCKQRYLSSISFSSSCFINSGVKWSDAVGAAADHISSAKNV
jgi:hypothetical protein